VTREQRLIMEQAHDLLIPAWRRERERQTVLRDWGRGVHVPPFKPREANQEYEALLEKSPVPLIDVVLRVLTQTLEIVDYNPGVADQDVKDAMKARLWEIWRRNLLPVRQKRLYRAAFQGGQSFALAVPGDTAPVIKVFSARNMIALYQDPEADEWPMVSAYSEKADSRHFHFGVVDEKAVHVLQIDADGGNAEYLEKQVHGTEIVPVVRYAGDVDDEGNVYGEVERLIPIQANIDQTNFDRLLTQSYSSWKIRYITGMEKPETDADAAAQKATLERDRLLLIENPEAKVGTLDGTELNGYIAARRDAKQDLATAAQISQKAIVGSQSNNADGAEAQAAEEASTQRKIHDYTVAFGESHGQLFRLAGLIDGIPGAWDDYAGAVEWANSEIRSLSQVADAVGKLRTQVDAPRRGLWEMLPGMSPERIKRWQEYAQEDPGPIQQLMNGL
jgi:hypothetical protein